MFGAAFLSVRQHAVMARDGNEATLDVGTRCGACKFQILDRAIQYPRALVQLRSSSSASNRLSDNNSTLFHGPNHLAVSMFRRLTRSIARAFAVIRQVALDTLFRSVDYARRRSGRDNVFSRKRSYEP